MKLHDANTTKKDHQLATYVTEEQYRAFSERAWLARMKVGTYLREKLQAAGELKMPGAADEDEAQGQPDARRDGDHLLDQHFDDDVLDVLAD